MAVIGSDEWLAGVVRSGAELTPAAGVDLVVQFEVAASSSSRSKKNVTRFWVELSDGVPASAGEGKHDDPSAVIACSGADGLALLRGDLDADVAFMQGRLKVDGGYEQLLFDLRHVFGREDHRQLRLALAANTELAAA